MFNLLEFAGGLGLTILIVIAITQVIIPELFGWPKFWLFDAKKRAKIEGHAPAAEPPTTTQKTQPKLNNGPKR